MSKTTQWTTDNKVSWYTSEEDVNDKIILFVSPLTPNSDNDHVSYNSPNNNR